MWKTIICPQCHQAAPYVLSQQVEDVDHDDENEMTLERWTRLLECPRCSNQWIDVDEYWEDD
jgi:cytochrome c-type biogenesis protein CcmH/NrfF